MDVSIRITGNRVEHDYDAFVADKLKDILEAGSRQDEKIVEEARKEARYRMRHNWRQMKEAIDAGRWAPEPPDSPRPFVDLGDHKPDKPEKFLGE